MYMYNIFRTVFQRQVTGMELQKLLIYKGFVKERIFWFSLHAPCLKYPSVKHIINRLLQ